MRSTAFWSNVSLTTKDKDLLYFAYGMNTNVDGMAGRCPRAVSFGRAQLLGHRFRFAGPADVQRDWRFNVDGVLWDITDQCLTSLDRLEGYPFYYNRRKLRVAHNDRIVMAETYYMQPGHRNYAPSNGYFNCVLEGYSEFGVPTEQLYKNVTESVTFLPYDFVE
jgi:gamma-glutamylcyclotransferase (GGCT)/AIG2-like uncharacterized protein YtfP